MIILNLTQHPATPEQIAAGVVDVRDRKKLSALLTFDSLPSRDEIMQRSEAIADLAYRELVGPVGDEDADCHGDGTAIWCMIGGAPYLMSSLESVLRKDDRVPLYALSVRESVEEVQSDGSIRKVNVFRHEGFVR